MLLKKNMLRVIFGFAVGIYAAQNYHIPDLHTILVDLQNTLTKYQKPPPTK